MLNDSKPETLLDDIDLINTLESSKLTSEEIKVKIEESVFIGVNATIRDHITIGERSLIGAGAIIMKSTDAESVYVAEATSPSNLKSTQIRSI